LESATFLDDIIPELQGKGDLKASHESAHQREEFCLSPLS